MYSQAADLIDTWTPRRHLHALSGWCEHELAPWHQRGSESGLHDLNAAHPWVFMFRITRHGATLVEKSNADAPGQRRAGYYLRFLDRVARQAGVEVLIAADLNDAPMASTGIPLFSFQKPTGSPNILMPDIDFLKPTHNSLPAWPTADWRPWSRKSHSAVFAGATTGGRVTRQAVDRLSLPRLRAGVFFQDKPEVVFRLPLLVACDSAETEATLRAMGFGVGPLTWREQFRHRCILSMDGNGATCSRVVIALRSNSVLLKYNSDHQLHYFAALTPWRHYVPIAQDSDVLDILQKPTADLHAIAREGRRFARTFLTRRAIERYMATLLRLYADLG